MKTNNIERINMTTKINEYFDYLSMDYFIIISLSFYKMIVKCEFIYFLHIFYT